MDRRLSFNSTGSPSAPNCYAPEVLDVAGDYFHAPEVLDVAGDYFQKPDLFGKLDDSDEDCDDDDKKKSAVVVTSSAVGKPPVEVTIDPEDLYLVSIDGYYRKSGGRNGGYGAMLRCEDGQAIAALAGASSHSVSEFYHTLEGIRAGFLLAIQNNVNYIKMVCNSDWAYWIVWQCFSSNQEQHCRAHPEGSQFHHFDVFCVSCFKLTRANADFDCNFEIMKDIVRLGKRYYRSSFISSVDRDWNEPADFLAKLERTPGEQSILRPHEFPDMLVSLLSKFDGELPFDIM